LVGPVAGLLHLQPLGGDQAGRQVVVPLGECGQVVCELIRLNVVFGSVGDGGDTPSRVERERIVGVERIGVVIIVHPLAFVFGAGFWKMAHLRQTVSNGYDASEMGWTGTNRTSLTACPQVWWSLRSENLVTLLRKSAGERQDGSLDSSSSRVQSKRASIRLCQAVQKTLSYLHANANL